MSLFKISKGLRENLPKKCIEGYCYLTLDDHMFYVDLRTSTDNLTDSEMYSEPNPYRIRLNAEYAIRALANVNGAQIGESLYFINGNSNTNPGTWTGTDSRIKSYYNGLTVLFVPAVAGAATTTLNINNLGAKTCYYNNSNKLTTHYAVGTPILLTYIDGAWKRADFDSNTTYVNMTADEGKAGTATTGRVISAKVLKEIIAAATKPTVSWANGTTAGPVLNVKIGTQTANAAIPIATPSTSGVVTTGDQSFSGLKTFLNNVYVRNNAGDTRLGVLNGAGSFYMQTDASADGFRSLISYNSKGTYVTPISITKDNAVTFTGNLTGTADNSYKLEGKSLNQIAPAKSTALSWNTETSIATIGGNEIKIKLPANPNTDTHWTTGIRAGASGTNANSALTNPFIKVLDNSIYRTQIQLKGAGSTTVASDANGVITITGATIPTALKNPKLLKIGGKTYDGSVETSITLADLGLSRAMRFIGTTTSLANGSTVTPTIESGQTNYTAKTAGDVVLNTTNNYEYLWTGEAWQVLGPGGSYDVAGTAAGLVNALDVNTSTTESAKTTFVSNVTQTNGKITVTKAPLDTSGTWAGKANTAGTADKANSVAWGNVSGKPSTFPPSTHTHPYLPLTAGSSSPLTGALFFKTDSYTGDIVARNASNYKRYEIYSGSSTGAVASGVFRVYTDDTGKAYKNYTFGTDGVFTAPGGFNGNASSATKLTSSAGSSTLPVYFSGGKPVACGNSLAVSITGNAASATKLQTARTIFGKSFNGTANVAGKPLVYGTYTATANQRYANSGIEIRENDLVGNAQSDIGYAPSIGFHWTGRIAGTLNFHSDGIFYFRKQNGTDRATIDANVNGNAATATNADKLDGYHGSSGRAANTYVLRDGNGYIYTNYINSNTGNNENPTISQIIVTNGSDNYYRKASLAHLKNSLGSMPPAAHTHAYLPLTGGTITGGLSITENLNFNNLRSNGDANGIFWQPSSNPANYFFIYPNMTNKRLYFGGIWGGQWQSPLEIYCDGSDCYAQANRLYGAVWNDYAEFRITKETIEPGRVVVENGDDTLSLSTQRLQRGCEIVSDTFGFAIGETDECKTPIAASGRVLAYPYEAREEFAKHIGYPVCSGPNGTVSIMTDEEEKKYPSRIIGTISAVPDYEEWGSGNVKVNGRVWIRIK